MKNKSKKKDRKMVSASSTVGAAGSIASAHNICHALCLAAVAFLSIFGIVVASDALMWLEAFAWPFWIMGLSFLGLSIALYAKFGSCISTRMLLINAGLLVVGAPFAQQLGWILWAPGMAIVFFGVFLTVKNRFYKQEVISYGQ